MTPLPGVRSSTPELRQHSGSRQAVATFALLVLSSLATPTAAQDPYLEYARRFGGDANEEVNDVAVDAGGNIYVTGWTQSEDFSGPDGGSPTLFGAGGGGDAFVVKLSADGSTILYATLFGGEGTDEPWGIAVDAEGSAYLAGETPSIDTGFPTTESAFRADPSHVFVAKLDPTGDLVYATYFGTKQIVRPRGLALHGSGDSARVYLTGLSTSGGVQTTESAFQRQLAGGSDAFLSVLEPARGDPSSQLVYSTYFGSSGPDDALDVAAGPEGAAYIMGGTNGGDLPIRNGFDASLDVSGDAFLAVFDPSRSGDGSLVYSTYIGGSASENGTVRYGGLAVGPAGVALVTGSTTSTDFPVTPEGHRVARVSAEAFLLAIDPSAPGPDSLRYGTFIGGSGADFGLDVTAGPPGIAYVVGQTSSNDLLTGDGRVAPKLGEGPPRHSQDAFVVKIDWTRVASDSMVDAAYIGGTGSDTISAVAASGFDDVWVAGETTSNDVFEPTPGLGARDGFVLHARTILELPLGRVGVPSTDALGADFGAGPYTWQVISGSPPVGLALSSDGVLSGEPTEVEVALFTVEVTNSMDAIRQQAYRKRIVPDVEPGDVLIRKGGVTPVPGRTLPYSILLRNRSDRTLYDVGVVELLEYWFEFLGSSPPPATLGSRPTGHVFWTIPRMLPGELVVITYRVRLPDDFPFGEEVSGEVCLTEEDCVRERTVCEEEGKEHCSNAGCVGAGSGVGCIQCNKQEREICRSQWFRCQELVGIGSAESPPEGGFGGGCATLTNRVLGPFDPNEKSVASGPFVPPGEVLGYTIFFENIGEIEALDVFLTDVLDDDLDLSTVRVKQRFGGLAPLATGGAVTIFEDGDEEWIVTLDSATRTLSWNLTGIDLAAGATDSVFFVVQAPEDLVTGTEIRNDATIQFEVFEPLTTNETLNTIDSTPPVGTMNPLPDASPTEDFEISWTGTDEVGEITFYAVYVSRDGGPFQQLIRTREPGSAVFEGETGSAYGFLCIAGDSAGNVEPLDDVAEVVIAVGAGERPLFHRGDPNSSGTADISDATVIFGFLFIGSPETLPCRESADVNNDGAIDVSDGVYLLNWLFAGGAPLPPPGPPIAPCGEDPDPPGSAGDLGCEAYGACQ